MFFVVLDKASKTYMSKLEVWRLGKWLSGQKVLGIARSPKLPIRGWVWCYKPVAPGMEEWAETGRC